MTTTTLNDTPNAGRPTIGDLIKNPVVGPLLQRYLRGRLEACEARRELLTGTINHVMALGMVDECEADVLKGLHAMFGEPPLAAPLGTPLSCVSAASVPLSEEEPRDGELSSQ